MKHYDIIIIGAGPGGIFSAYELATKRPDLKIAVFEAGNRLEKRKCPIDGKRVTKCIHCKTCAIMNGFGGAGAFSDGKYNITNEFGGTLYEYIGKNKATELMEYVDEINMAYGGEGTRLYSSANSSFKRVCLQHNLHLLEASVRHLGTDKNYEVLSNLYNLLKDKVSFYFMTPVQNVAIMDNGDYEIITENETYTCEKCIISVGRSGSKWMEQICHNLEIPTNSSRVDIGVRVELPAEVFAPITDELYESKIVYQTEKYQDRVRTFCMNPKGAVVTARLSNMLGGGVMVQRFGDLIRGQRSNPKRIAESFLTPTLDATPGDLSLVMPKRILDGIIEMIYALDNIAPGTANDDTLLYGVEVKFYNMEVQIDNHLETRHKNLFVIGDGSGVTHSLSHASASGIYVARHLLGEIE